MGMVWFGLYDDQLFVDYGDRRYGPYAPINGPIPLHRYRRFKTIPREQRVDCLEALAEQLVLPRTALRDAPTLASTRGFQPITQPFADADLFYELTFPRVIEAKRAIADRLGLPLAKLPRDQ
jgi:hypothetical protein